MADETKGYTTWSIVKAVSAIMVLVAMFYSFDAYLESKIEKHLNDPMVTKRIAKQVRPFAIFSGTGTILFDKGAMDFLEDINVPLNGTSRIPKKVIVVPKSYMAHAPLITAIDQVGAVARAKRGKGLTWEYTFDNIPFILEPGIGPEKETTAEDDRYRLEIIE